MTFDLYWFSALYGLAGSSSVGDWLAVFFASYSQYVWAAVLLLFFFWPMHGRVQNRIMIVLSVAAALVARLVVKGALMFAYPRPRPFVELASVHPLINSPLAENFQSFPSGHTIFFFALATVIYCFNRTWGTVALVAAALVGLSRIYVGVHWPTDVLAGALLGALTGWAVYRFYIALRVRYFNPVV
ncbi:MAG: phosphatase PAP2 family protein [Candidatus Paceibacterota bacterium]|jgi:undecaprenyl-diphosphatase